MLAEIGGEFHYTAGGRDYSIPAAVAVPAEDLLIALTDPISFAHFAEVPEGITMGPLQALRDAYCAHQGLLSDPQKAHTLRAIMTKFGEALEADFARNYPGVDAAELWRARRWRRLDNLIYRLPPASLYREQILNDPELVRAMVARQAEEDSQEKKGIAISEYTTPVSVLRDVVGELRLLRAVLIGVNSKGGRMPRVESYPGPITAVTEAQFWVRKAAHDSLTARVLRKKPKPDPVE